MEKVKSVDEFFASLKKWDKELSVLRSLLLTTKLKEELKWGMPTYCMDGKNVISIASYKSYLGIWFHQGVFLEDTSKVLHVSKTSSAKAMRQWRFSSIENIDSKLVLNYIDEAIQNQLDGKEVKIIRDMAFDMAPKLKEELNNDSNFSNNFHLLTKGKQKEYSNYISEAKREVTQDKRLLKIIPMINKGIGLHDKYKNC